MARPIFQVLMSHLVFGIASVVSEKVSRCSHSTLQQYVPLYWAEKVSIHGLIK